MRSEDKERSEKQNNGGAAPAPCEKSPETPAAADGAAEPSDEALAALARSGDRAAEEQLMTRYKNWTLQRSRMYFIAGADRDDVLQECMIGLFEAIRDYDPSRGASFRTFADLCVSRRVVSAVRAADRGKHRVLRDSLSLDVELAGNGGKTLLEMIPSGEADDPADRAWLAEAGRMLERDELPFLSRLENQIWRELRRGKSYREIAETLGRKPKSVDNAIQRIKAKCRRYLHNG